jgi:hypothetical protein
MSPRSRILFAAASLILGLAFVLPIWAVYLEAPQYPEGRGMLIRIDDITGIKPNDLDNINNLNHYIGMKRIEPASIPELRCMPRIVAALLATGAAPALVARCWMARAWVGAFVIVGLAGRVACSGWE